MDTNALIRQLAADTPAVAPARLLPRLMLATLTGLLLSGSAAVFWLGPSADLTQGGQATAMKLGFTLAMALLCIGLLGRHVRPGAQRARPWRGVAAVVLAMAGLGWIAWLQGTWPTAQDALLGSSWASCPHQIAALSLPPLLLLLPLLRGRATVTPRRTGAVAGLAAGALGAAGYALHCPESSPWFVLIWYGLGMLIPAALGAFLGVRWLRW
jgi:hypothetical protein